VSARRYAVAAEGEIPPGGRKIVTIERRQIGIFNVDGEYFALRNRCPHQGAALCEGHVLAALESTGPGDLRLADGRLLQCPWHGWEFDVRTGQSWCEPQRTRVRAYPVRVVEPGEAARFPGLVPGPHVAETYPVSVQQRQIVVELGG
jgi:3-phenylpropionate/trans-cinnamate dioxygenase ferredoxin subunit